MVDAFKLEAAKIIRDTTHNLVITEENEFDNEIFFTRTKYYIGLVEGSRKEAYYDGIVYPKGSSKFISVRAFKKLDEATRNRLWREATEARKGQEPVITVGMGANLEIPGALEKYDGFLGKSGFMQKVKAGEEDLNDDEIEIIFRGDGRERLVRLRGIYGSDWKKFKANEKMSTLSSYINAETLVNARTNYRKHIHNYVETNNEIYLRYAADEILKRSNPDKHPGLQNRRIYDATLLASYDCPTYTKPNQSPDAVKLKTAKLGETRVPFRNERTPGNGSKSAYFIWRTQMDGKVRKDHALLEGKVFRKTPPFKDIPYMPSAMHNCRCYAEEVPDYITIDDPIARNIAFEIYLRTGLAHPILLIE